MEASGQSRRGRNSTSTIESDSTISKTGLPSPPLLSPEETKRLYRKVDIRLIPILALMYLFAGVDRGNIGNARLQGLESQLGLVGDQFNVALTMFFIPYCLFECPSNLVIKRFLPSRWLPGITILWGAITALMGLVKNYRQLVGVRVCLGIAEAGLFPGVVYYLTLWYPRSMLQSRIGFFFGAGSLAGAFSGLWAYGISFMGGVGGFESWSWIFILEGSATVLVGIFGLFILPNFPHGVSFLTPEEQAYVLHNRGSANSDVGEDEHFSSRHVWDALKDWQVWLQILVYFCIVGPLYGIALFLPTIINGFGYSTAVSQLLTIPPYIVATILMVTFSIWSDAVRKRSPFILAGLCMLVVGYSINISAAPAGVKYFGTFFCVAGAYAAFPGTVAWLGNNLSGHYKRAVGMALQIGIGNFGGAVASNVYRSQDAPRYLVGHGIMLMFVGIGLITVPTVAFIYHRTNQRRAATSIQNEDADSGARRDLDRESRELGDKASTFRYIL